VIVTEGEGDELGVGVTEDEMEGEGVMLEVTDTPPTSTGGRLAPGTPSGGNKLIRINVIKNVISEQYTHKKERFRPIDRSERCSLQIAFAENSLASNFLLSEQCASIGPNCILEHPIPFSLYPCEARYPSSGNTLVALCGRKYL
jgi:hypothetical protein